jgi:hypothetical protein
MLHVEVACSRSDVARHNFLPFSDICPAFQIAVTRLGFGPAMHMKQLLFEESGIPTFHHGEKIDWKAMLEAFNSGLTSQSPRS